MSSADLTTCDREPIHIPGSIQPHGALLAFDSASLVVTRASANIRDLLGDVWQMAVGASLDALLPEVLVHALRSHPLPRDPVCIGDIEARHSRFHVLGHRAPDGAAIIEFEPAGGQAHPGFQRFYSDLWSFIPELQALSDPAELMQFAASEVRRITGFDRVLIYRFDEDWNGTVVAEDRNDKLPSYLDLRFPASDIPAQARELYRINRVRLIADAQYSPVPVGPAGPTPLNMTHCVLRSVSPVHVEYMRNMGTPASMSISLLQDGELWGLISCHHSEPRHVGFELRTACDLVGQVFSLGLGARERAQRYEDRLQLRAIHARLLASMAEHQDFVDGLLSQPSDLLDLAHAQGAAVLFAGTCRLVGATPSEDQVRALVDKIGDSEIWHTDSVRSAVSAIELPSEVAAGVLATAISKLHRSYVVWFRPEVVRTVKWGGDPRKPAEPEGDSVRLHPRKSFEMWCETVRNRSLPWTAEELEAARELRNSIVGIVLRQAEELAELSAELDRSNKELEAFSYSVSHDLRSPFRHIVGYAELLRDSEGEHFSEDGKRYLSTIVDSAHFAGALVDNLLMFSQIGRTSLNRTPVDMNSVFRDARARLQEDMAGRNMEWQVGRLATVEGDPMLLRLAMQNLLSNAIKYTRPRDPAIIQVTSETIGREVVFCVRDNGVGFDMAYSDKLFGVFQRLHRMEDFEGTGIGLANVRRIVSRHGGRTWAEGSVGAGAAFWFALPLPKEDESH